MLGRLDEAETLYRETLALQPSPREAARGEGVAATLNNLGSCWGRKATGRGRAPPPRGPRGDPAVRGPEHPDVAAGLSTLGGVLESKGDLAGAERLYRESLDLRLRLLGKEHPDTARSRYASRACCG